MVSRDCDCQRAATLNDGELSYCIELVTSRRIHDLGDHCRRQAILVQDVLPTTAQRYDAAVSEFEIFRRFQDTHGLEELVSTGLDPIGRSCIQYIRVCSAAGSLGPGEWGTLTSGLRRCVLLARACGAKQTSSERDGVSTEAGAWSSQPAPNPDVNEIALVVVVSAWVDIVPDLALLTVVPLSLATRRSPVSVVCDIDVFHESVAERCDQRRGAGHATQQIVLLKVQDSVIWSDDDESVGPRKHGLGATIWTHSAPGTPPSWWLARSFHFSRSLTRWCRRLVGATPRPATALAARQMDVRTDT